MVEGTRFPELEHRLPGFGAFKQDDVEDARRREPASDLRGYAESRGLEFLDRLNPVGYWGVVPDDMDGLVAKVLGLARTEGLGQL